MKRVDSKKETIPRKEGANGMMLSSSNTSGTSGSASALNASTTQKKGPMDWAQKRASKLITAPQPRLTEFHAVFDSAHSIHDVDDGEEAALASAAASKKAISSTSLQDLIPITIARDLAERSDKLQQTPYYHQVDAACLFLDISQFTKISENISSQGGLRGPEKLAAYINQLFTQLVRLVNKAGGDILKFAGDAVIILWLTDVTKKDGASAAGGEDINAPAPHSKKEGGGGGGGGDDLTAVARRAVQCAWDVQETLPKMEMGEEAKGLTLAFKAGVGVGKVSIVHLGGGKLAFGGFEAAHEDGRVSGTFKIVDPRSKTSISTGDAISGRREYVAVGAPLVQAFAAEHHAQRNDIVVSRQTWSLVSEFFESKRPKTGKLPEGYVLIDRVKEQIKKKKQEKFAVPSKEWMLTYVPRSAHLFLEVELHTRKDWVSELRRVTVLFINLGVPKSELSRMLQDHEGLEKLHDYFSATQTAVMDYEGSINKYLMDDKGSTVIAVFGLPPISHENDATRGVLAALAISAFLQELGAEPAVGIATGIAFCGVVGHPGGRREYTVLGDIVNLAARLMQRATLKQEGVLTDTETYLQAQDQIQFNYLKEVQVKGKSKRIDVWQPHQRGFKTKRTLLGKALGVKKHRRRRSLDADWREQVSQFNGRHVDVGMDARAVRELKAMLETEQARILNGGARDGSRMVVIGSELPPQIRNASTLPQDMVHHEDERNLDSDSHDKLIHVMAEMHAAILGRSLESSSSSSSSPVLSSSAASAGGFQVEYGRGRPRSIVLEGSIGTGKSRILARLAAVISAEPGIWVLDAACNPFERGALARPFGLFITLIGIALWAQHAEVSRLSVEDAQAALEDIPPSARRGYLLRWLASSPKQKVESYYLLNEDFGVDFEMPRDANSSDKSEEHNRLLIDQKTNLIFAIFQGICQERRVVCMVDDAVYLDSPSWGLALRLGREGATLGQGICVLIASRPITDFVLIDANSRASYQEFQRMPGLLLEDVPPLPSQSVRRLAMDQMNVRAMGPEIEVALEKCQGNPLFVRELVQSMMDKEGVLDVDEKLRVATFGTAAAMKLDNKDEFPSCTRCSTRFTSTRQKHNCRVCGHVVCTTCAPPKNKRFAIGYKEPVQCCLDCSRDSERHRRFTAAAIQAMDLDPPVAIVCVIGTWIDKLTTPQQMILKVACLLRDGMRFEKTKAFEAYPLDPEAASFDIEFDALVKLGFVRNVQRNPSDQAGVFNTVEDEDLFEFCHNFLPDVLNQRVLSSQRDELQSHVDEARARREELERIRFMQSKGDKLAQLKLKDGYVLVHKKNISSNRKPWKPRWCIIIGHRIEFYYERDAKAPSSACDLKQAKVSVEKGKFAERERVIKLQVASWEKRGKLINERREFFISPELGTDQERDAWVYFLKMAIESEAGIDGNAVPTRKKRGPSVSGWFKGGRKGSANPKEEPPSSFSTSDTARSEVPRKSRGLELRFGGGGKKDSSGTAGGGGAPVPSNDSPRMVT